MNDLVKLGEDLKKAVLDPKKGVEIAAQLCIANLYDAHEEADVLEVEVERAKVKMKDENPKMSQAEVEMRVKATDLYLKRLKAKHRVERIEEFIKVAKRHANLADGY